MHPRGDYRIRNSKKTEDDIDIDLQQHLKESTHIHNQKRQNIAALVRPRNESARNSRLKENHSKLKQSRTQSGFGSMIGSRVGRVIRMSKNEKTKNIVTDIEFNNIRWISIVSAYDSKRLKHVTVSKQSCEAFLKKYGREIKNDPAAMAYFKDIKKHFHSWLAKINEAFKFVLDHFLSENDKQALVQLEKMAPTLEEIRSDTAMMREKLQGCLKHYENNDFRRMAQRFDAFFTQSNKLDHIISIIFQKKEKIDSLFQELQNTDKIDRNLEKIRKEGMKQTKKLIYSEKNNYSPNICDKIMQKVTHAINSMASKSLNIFHKLQGAKQLISRIRKILNDTQRRLSIKEIKKFSQIFHEILQETADFEDFAEQFDSENDCVTPQLRDKIHQCRQDLVDKKRAVGQIQVIFVSTVISQTIIALHQCHSLNQTLTKQHTQYQEYNHLLEAIADAMLDQTKRTVTEGLVKQNRTAFSRLEEDLDKIRRNLKRHEDGLIIDTQDGQVASMECSKLTKDYKDKIKHIIKKHEDALRHLDAPLQQLRLPSQDKDSQILFLNKLVAISEIINSRERHQKITHEKGFHQLKGGISTSAAQVQQTYSILQELQESRINIKQLNEQNPLKQLVKEIRSQNGLYLECNFLLNMFKLVPQASDKNVIPILGKLSDISAKRKTQLQKQKHYKQTKAYRHAVDRIYCLILLKGLKKAAIKEIDESKHLTFPENQYEKKQMQNEAKYRSLIIDALGEEAHLAKRKLTNAISIMKDLVNGKALIQKLRANQNGQYVALISILSNFSSQLFKLCMLKSKQQGLSTEARRITLQLSKCLKAKSSNIDILQDQLEIENHQASLRVRKEFIYYKNTNENTLKACEDLSKTQDNDPLKTLSNLTHIIAQYIHSTKQSSYIALNEWRQPVWIGVPEQSKNGLCNQIDLNGYPRGTFVDTYTHQAPKIYDQKNQKQMIKSVKDTAKQNNQQIPRKKSSKIVIKQKSHPRDSMDEQIFAIESENELNEDIPDIDEDQMEEQIDNEAQQNIQENEMTQDIYNQVEDFHQEQMEQKMGQQIQEESDVKIIKPNIMEKQKHLKQQTKGKQKQSILTNVYEIIPFFRQLQQMRQLIEKIDSSQKLFWKQYIDFQQILDYYHRQQDLKDRGNFIKSLQNCFSMFLGNRFGPKLGQIVKHLDRLKAMKGLILSLGQKNWQHLFKILTIVQRNYSILLSNKSEVLQLFTYDGDNRQFRKQSSKKCIYDYLQRTFKTPYFTPESFDYEGFISTCLQTEVEELVNKDDVNFHYIIKYTAKTNQSLPTQDTDKQLKELKQIENKFGKQLNTGINLGLTCLQFWIKAIDSNTQDCYKPDYSILDMYIKQLNKLQKKQWICHYLADFSKSLIALKAKIKTHKNNIDNLFFKVDNTNVLECLENLASYYENASPNKVYFINRQGKKMPIFISRGQSSIALNQTSLAFCISHLFDKIKGKDAQTVTKSENIINQIEKIHNLNKANNEQLSQLMEFLNILEIEHYFISKPNFLFKNSFEQLALSILKPLGAQSTQQMNYQQLVSNLFHINKKAFSTQLIIKENVNLKMLSQEYINEIKQNVKKIESDIAKAVSNFKSKIQSIDMSTLLPDYLLDKTKNNELLTIISQYSSQLTQFKVIMNGTICKNQQNLLIYIHSHRKVAQNLTSLIDQKLAQINSLSIPSVKTNDINSQLETINKLFFSIKNWSKTVGLAKQFTNYLIVSDEKTFTVNIQFGKLQNKKQKSKQYLQTLLKRNWLTGSNWTTLWNFLYDQYIVKQIKTENDAEGNTCIYYNFEASIKSIIQDIRLDLAEKTDIIDLTKYHNIHKFTRSSQALEIFNKSQTQIIQRLTLKKQLLQLKKVICKTEFLGLKNLIIAQSLLDCFKDQLDIQQEELDSIISQTNSLKPKQTNLAQFTKWYSLLAHDKLGCFDFQLRSSTGIPIAILPVLRIQKDKTKNTQQISHQLKDIKLSTEFHLKLQQGVQIVYLQSQIVTCIIKDSQNYLINDKQLKDFQPELAEGEMVLLMIQQTNDESIPLQISPLQLEVTVQLQLSEDRTTTDVSCGVWKIGVEDYQNIKKQKVASKQQERKAIRKKLRGLASPEDKIKDVNVGQRLTFGTIGKWLKEELKKNQQRMQEKESAQLERQKQAQILRKESQSFLNQIEEELKQQNIPFRHLILKQIDEQKLIAEGQQNVELKGYYKKLDAKTQKVIEKLQENKSLEEVGRLKSLIKTYIQVLKKKLIENYQIQLKLTAKAQSKFGQILKKRQSKAKQMKNTTNIQPNTKQEGILNELQNIQLQRQKDINNLQAEQSAKIQSYKSGLPSILLQTSKLSPPKNTFNIQKNISNPPPEAQKASKPSQQKQINIIELIKQRPQLKNQKMQAFLMEWVECQQPKDADYYRCLLQQFCELTPSQIQSMTQLK